MPATRKQPPQGGPGASQAPEAGATPTQGGEGTPGRPEGLWNRILYVVERVHRVPKTGHNREHDYWYATEADILEAIRPLLCEAGLLLLFDEQECVQMERKGRNGLVSDMTRKSVRYTLVDTDSGQQHSFSVTGYGQDTLDKGPYKALTGIHKYAIMKTFQIPTGDDPEATEGAEETQPTGKAPARRQAKKPARGSPQQQQEEEEDDPLARPASLSTINKTAELAKDARLPPSERQRATKFLAAEGLTERSVRAAYVTLRKMLDAIEAQEQASEQADY